MNDEFMKLVVGLTHTSSWEISGFLSWYDDFADSKDLKISAVYELLGA